MDDLFFLLAKIGWQMVAPASLLALVGGIALVMLAVGGWQTRGIGQSLAALVGLVFFLVALLPIGPGLVFALEQRVERPALPPQAITGIVLLGGVADPVASSLRSDPVLLATAERVVQTAILSRRHPDAPIIIAGGTARITRTGEREADILKQILVDLGVDEDRIRRERNSRNTHENARFARELADRQGEGAWLLVTSAWHMPRALGSFRAAGWQVIPWPTDYRTVAALREWVRFDPLGNLADLHLGLREWAALAVYRLTGRSDAIFPALSSGSESG